MGIDTQTFFSRRKKKSAAAPVGAQPVIESAGKPRKMSVLTKIKTAVKLRQVIKQSQDTFMKTGSWKTTLGGVIMALGPISKGFLPAHYAWVSDALLSLGALLVGATARDNSVTSEEAGAKGK